MDNYCKKAMKQKWTKHGLIFKPNGAYWQMTHAAIPTALKLNDNTYRIYFSSRDKNNYAHIGYFDWEVGVSGKIIEGSKEPVLSPGKLGWFDGQGIQATSVVKHDGQVYMYYLGWNVGYPSPLFYTSIGLAISADDGRTFNKYSKAPILDRSEYDPWMVSGGTVLKLDEGNWMMWYLSGQNFEISETGVKSSYDIKIAKSTDGIQWVRKGKTALPLYKNESNISRLSVINDNGLLRAWYPVKEINDIGYKLGYAESVDGVNWDRKDEQCVLDRSNIGWDSDSIDKMEVIRQNDKYYMLYNGNRFGYDGIGLATLNSKL